METWVWLVAYVVGFALLQLSLYRYFMKSTRTEPTERTTPASEGSARAVEPAEGAAESDLISCENCGTYNENHTMYSFCRECGERLT